VLSTGSFFCLFAQDVTRRQQAERLKQEKVNAEVCIC